jgi:hypothetical protein
MGVVRCEMGVEKWEVSIEIIKIKMKFEIQNSKTLNSKTRNP